MGEVRGLSLFPLHAVLFPGEVISIHVFEERYRQLMADVLASDGEFGVVLIKDGREVGGPAVPHPVGTVARVVEVNRLEDGRMYLLALGLRRFHINEVFRPEPYPRALVEVLEEEAPPVPTKIVEVAREAFAGYVGALRGLQGGWVHDLHLVSDPPALSYLIGSVLRGGLVLKQRLLEAPSPAERLQLGIELLLEDTERVRDELQRRGPLSELSRN